MQEQAKSDHQKAISRTAISASVVHEAIAREGADELKRPAWALAWSALAAGLSMGFSFVAEGILLSMLPDLPWGIPISKFGYCIGFLIVILGRQQLFTENTLTVILPLLQKPSMTNLRSVARLWVIVLLGNLAGALIFSSILVYGHVFEEPVQKALTGMGVKAFESDFAPMFWRGVFAGWLIALMVWLLPFAESGRVGVIIIITYLVGIGGFTHIVAGSVEGFYLALKGVVSWQACLGKFMLPALIGNIVGGVTLVAMLNHAQVVAGGGEDI